MSYKELSLGSNVEVFCEDENCTIYKVHGNSGEGTMTCYSVFPGINLMYNDFHMDTCISEFNAEKDMFSIEHCREGRIELNVCNGAYSYIGAGDVRIDNRKFHDGKFVFPLKHYHGISISFTSDEAEKSIKSLIKDFPVSISELQNRFCQEGMPIAIRNQEAIDRIFLDLYFVPAEIKMYYFKTKVLELLLFMSALKIPDNCQERPYFYKTQVEKVKAIEKFITDNLEKHYTLDELSRRFDIALTSMKNCFKGVYGSSIYSYIRTYRMNRAAFLLRKTTKSIVAISGLVGYESHSKFSAAFKDIMGKTPFEYRKSIV